MRTPADGALWATKTICGHLIPEQDEGAGSEFARFAGSCHRQLVGYALEPVARLTPPKGSNIDGSELPAARDAYVTHMESLGAGTRRSHFVHKPGDDARVAALAAVVRALAQVGKQMQEHAQRAAEKYICQVAQRLIEERDATARNGFDATQGRTTAGGVSFLDLNRTGIPGDSVV